MMMILSAFLAEETRLLTIIVVLFLQYSNKLLKIISSVSVSTADKQSSSNRISGFLINALAIETRCF